MRRKVLLVSLVCILTIFLSMELSWSQENNFSLEERIEQLKNELDRLYSLLEKQKREYIKQHPIQIKPSVEPNVMWELAKETEGEESYKYLEKYIKYFPDSPKVQDAMWYMMSMANSDEVDKDPFVLLDKYAKAFPTDGVDIRFAKASLHYHKVDWRFWAVTPTEEEIQDNKENVLKGIEFFEKAIALAKPKDRFKGFKSPTTAFSMSGLFYDWGDIQESARWNIAEGYERLKMWKEAIDAYSVYLLEFPESDEVDKAKAKIYLFRQRLGQSE